MKIALPRNRFGQSDMNWQSGEALIIRRLVQATIQSGRTDLKGIRIRNQIFDIQNQADLLADSDTILVSDPAWLININSQNGTATSARQFDMNYFQSLTRGDSFSDFDDALVCFH